MRIVCLKVLLVFLLLSNYSCNKQIEVVYYSNGIIKEKHELRNGKYDGDSFYYYKDGTLQAKGEFKRGIMDGEWRYYYEDGEIMTVQRIQKGGTVGFDCWDQKGEKVVDNGTGTIVFYYPSGSPQQEITYKNCHFDGINRSWYPNGYLEYEQFFDEGEPVGIWHQWDEKGNVVSEANYDTLMDKNGLGVLVDPVYVFNKP